MSVSLELVASQPARRFDAMTVMLRCFNYGGGCRVATAASAAAAAATATEPMMVLLSTSGRVHRSLT